MRLWTLTSDPNECPTVSPKVAVWRRIVKQSGYRKQVGATLVSSLSTPGQKQAALLDKSLITGSKMVRRPSKFSACNNDDELASLCRHHVSMLMAEEKLLLRQLEGSVHKIRREDNRLLDHQSYRTSAALTHIAGLRAQWKADLIGQADAAILLASGYRADMRTAARRLESQGYVGPWHRPGRIHVSGYAFYECVGMPRPKSLFQVAGPPRPYALSESKKASAELEACSERLREFAKRVRRWRPMSFWTAVLEKDEGGPSERSTATGGTTAKGNRHDRDERNETQEGGRHGEQAHPAKGDRYSRGEGCHATLHTPTTRANRAVIGKTVHWPSSDDGDDDSLDDIAAW